MKKYLNDFDCMMSLMSFILLGFFNTVIILKEGSSYVTNGCLVLLFLNAVFIYKAVKNVNFVYNWEIINKELSKKSKKQLYTIMGIMLDNKKLLTIGLCEFVHQLRKENLITIDDMWLIQDYIKENTPSPYYNLSRFLRSGIPNDKYWWQPYNKNQRLKWIRKHMSVLQ